MRDVPSRSWDVKAARWFAARWPALVAIVVVAVLLVLLRGHWLVSANSLSPDEAQLLAAGKQAARDMIPYRTYTTYTYLFLWPMFLGVLRLIGVPLTLASAHVIAGIFALILIVTGWQLIAKQRGWLLSALIVLPTALYLLSGAGQQFDFLALGTESLPIVVICIALFTLFSDAENLTRRKFLLGSAVCGVAPWAKPQLGPLALALVLSCALLRILESATLSDDQPGAFPTLGLGRELRGGLLAFFAPTVLAVVFLAVTGELRAFISFGLEGTSGILSYVGSSNAVAISLASRVQSWSAYIFSYAIAFVWALGGLIGWRRIRGPQRRVLEEIRATCWALPLVAAGVTLLVLQQLYAHYADIMFAACMVSGVLGARLSRLSRGPTVRWDSRGFALAACVVTLIVLVNNTTLIRENAAFASSEVVNIATSSAALTTDNYDAIGSDVPETCPQGSRVFVYGWANELYSYYSWEPATQALVENWGLSNERAALPVVRVLLSELEAAPPRCIIEANGPYFFGSIATIDTIQRIIPGISKLLRTCYRSHESPVGMAAFGYTGEQGQTVEYWVRKDTCHEIAA